MESCFKHSHIFGHLSESCTRQSDLSGRIIAKNLQFFAFEVRIAASIVQGKRKKKKDSKRKRKESFFFCERLSASMARSLDCIEP